jgi:signal peptidase I
MSKNTLAWIKDIAIVIVIMIIVLQFIKPTIVRGTSMQDTLQPNDYIFLSKQAYNMGGEPERGDIVVFPSSAESGGETEKNLIKRVIALGGDTVEIYDGIVYVNDEPTEEPSIKDGYTDGQMPEITVPEDHLFLLGDNRQSSRDSRDPSVGFVPKDKLIGKAVFRVFPFSDFGPID